jgi:hypothetical protein
VKDLKLIDAIYQAAKTGTKVEVKLWMVELLAVVPAMVGTGDFWRCNYP